MKGFILSLRSEYYKSRKTAGFWGPIILPIVLCALVAYNFYIDAPKFKMLPSMLLWMRFSGGIMGVMGTLLLPILIVFISYSINSVEHKADTWKSIFSLPIPKASIYISKIVYAILLIFLCLFLFCAFTIGLGNLMGRLNPDLKFGDFNFNSYLISVYFKLFLSSMGILSIQFLLSLLFRDFLKPMGIGFIATITGVVAVVQQWSWNYLFPYSHPLLAMQSLAGPHRPNMLGIMILPEVQIFTREVWVSLIIAAVVFAAGFVIVQKRSVK